MRVREALALMQALVCKGDMQGARELGMCAEVPLGLSPSELQLGERLAEGAESEVYAGTFRGIPVAVKRLRLRTHADLDRSAGLRMRC